MICPELRYLEVYAEQQLDQCMAGLRNAEGDLIRKRTTLAGTVEDTRQAFDTLHCNGAHRHGKLKIDLPVKDGFESKAMATYPDELTAIWAKGVLDFQARLLLQVRALRDVRLALAHLDAAVLRDDARAAARRVEDGTVGAARWADVGQRLPIRGVCHVDLNRGELQPLARLLDEAALARMDLDGDHPPLIANELAKVGRLATRRRADV